MTRTGYAFAVFAVVSGIVIALSTAFRWEVQWLSPARFGETGWWFRHCEVDAGTLRYTSFSFLGVTGSMPRPELKSKVMGSKRNGFGLSVGTFRFPSAGGRFELAFPLWPAVPILAGCSFLCLRIAASRRQARKLNLCFVCGYDLRATPGRCPECGEPVGARR